MIDSVRARLTFWHIAVLSLVLLIFSASIYVLLARNLHRRTDATIAAALAAMEHLLAYERAEGDSELEAARNTVAELRYPQIAMAVYAADGRLLAETRLDAMQAALPAAPASVNETPYYLTLAAPHDPTENAVRVAVQRVTPAAGAAANLIVVAHSLEQSNEEMEVLRQVFMLAVPLALALVGLSGWFLTRKNLAPLAAIAAQAEQIGAANLSARLPVADARDELGRVAVTFNQLLARLENAFAQQRQFMTDASHELRTPLHIIRSAAEIYLQPVNGNLRAAHEYQEALTMVNEQACRLTRIVEDLFTLARADAGQRVLEPCDLYLDELVQATARAAALLAVQKDVTITAAPAPEAPWHGDENLLRQMLLNLLDNAVKHTPAGGTVSVQLSRGMAAYEITVADNGSGIPAAAQAHIFERFYRADEARTRADSANGSGAGLGLAIARWIAEAHRGKLVLHQSDAHGSVFLVTLPHTEK
jgi:two-component system OmpR family sensor kinase